MNPITDVYWPCIFPIKIAGVTLISGPEDMGETIRSPICVCPLDVPPFFRIGITVSFWEPTRLNEVVKDPFCFPTLGFGLGGVGKGMLTGDSGGRGHAQASRGTAAQGHWFIFPVWTMLELLTDFICVEHSGFDIAYLTEIDPMWNDDTLALIIHPEALLFANPVAQTACIADSVASNAGAPLSPLFWCMGSWGSAYPMGKKIDNEVSAEGAAGLGARLIYKLGRQGLIWDRAANLCFATPALIWNKNHWRFQMARPSVGRQCIPTGRSSVIWGAGKNVPKPGADNFLFIMFDKRRCCAF
ncbi:MAG: TraU family protein [Thermoplasmatales archaeon]